MLCVVTRWSRLRLRHLGHAPLRHIRCRPYRLRHTRGRVNRLLRVVCCRSRRLRRARRFVRYLWNGRRLGNLPFAAAEQHSRRQWLFAAGLRVRRNLARGTWQRPFVRRLGNATVVGLLALCIEQTVSSSRQFSDEQRTDPGMFRLLKLRHMRDNPLGRVGDHLRVIFQGPQTQQPIMRGRPLVRRNVQPNQVGIETRHVRPLGNMRQTLLQKTTGHIIMNLSVADNRCGQSATRPPLDCLP